MPTYTEGKHTLEFLLSEASGHRSRDEVTVTVTGGVAMPSGTVLGKITATGKYVRYNNAASDGSEVAAAILINPLPGVNGDYTKRAVIARDAEAMSAMLTGRDTAGDADLKALGIIVR